MKSLLVLCVKAVDKTAAIFGIAMTTATLPVPSQNAMANELKYCYVPTLVSRVT